MKNALFLFVLLLGLGACNSAIVTPVVTIITPSKTLTTSPTDTSTPTDTLLPTDTPTPKASPTPDLAAQAAITQAEFANFQWADFVPTTQEQFLALAEKVTTDASQFQLPLRGGYIAVTNVSYGDNNIGIDIAGMMGDSLVPRYAISVPTAHGTEHLILWEAKVLDPADNTRLIRVCLTTSFDPVLDIEYQNNLILSEIHNMAGMSTIVFHALINSDGEPSADNSVVKIDLTQKNPVFDSLEKRIIPADVGTQPIWISSVYDR